MLRLLSYLAPSIPHGFFRAIGSEISAAVGVAVDLAFETRTSGPVEGESDPLSRGEIDIAFLCAPTYLWLESAGRARLLRAAPVSTDPRAEGRPVYFSDVIVASASRATRIADLATARWAVNDPSSLSGYRCVVDALGAPAELVVSGSHLASLEFVRDGRADAAAIDSNVLRLHPPADGVRVIDAFGPHPIQPLVARIGLDSVVVQRIEEALLTLQARAPGLLTEFGFAGFGAVDHAHYARSARVRHRMEVNSTLATAGFCRSRAEEASR